MTKSITFLLLFVVFSQLNAKNTTIRFKKGVFILTDSAKSQLDTFAVQFRKSKNKMDLNIVGHTDSDGSISYNQELSLNRARATRQYLISKGVKNRISLYSKGEHKLLAKGKASKDHQKNRRVEIISQKRSSNNWNPFGIAKLQVHQINVNRENEITGEKGTKIKFQKNCFRIPKGDSLVDISFREYTTKADALFANLSTMTPDGKLIESKGMIHISAKTNNRPVTLKSNKPMELTFPARKTGDSTLIFYGKRFENGVIWIAGQKQKRCATTVIDRATEGSERSIIFRETCRSNDGLVTITTFWGNGTIVEQRSKNSSEHSEPPLVSSRLGWINCDKFNNNKSPKINFVVKLKNKNNASVYLIFDDINSIMPYSYKENNEYHFNNVPVGTKVKVVALVETDKKEECLLAQAPTKINDKFNKKLSFKRRLKKEVELN